METLKLSIDNQEVQVPKGVTVLQAAEVAGVEIPVFCYHNRLKIAGNCRMCLVEVEGGPPKPIASCAMPAAEGMKINTRSKMVQKARQGVLEFLLINHPLDCPICDQGGECDLQDITMAYGRDQSRFSENKRAVQDKYMGPLIKTFMTRCIHCTRCIRFAEDVAGVPELGTLHRGEKLEITTYLDQAITSELSGNLVDLCPVGALTSRPYAFRGRPWELTAVESVDVLDGLGSNIRIDVSGDKVMRILPRLNESINEEWISDKTRYACDGLSYQRLDQPYVKKEGKLVEATWDQAFMAIKDKLSGLVGSQIGAVAGDLVDVESMIALKDFMALLGSDQIDCRQDGAYLETEYRSSYLFNTTLAGIHEADICLIIGGHLRYDAPILNARFRKRFLKGGFETYRIGGSYAPKQEPTFPIAELGNSLTLLEDILQERHELSEKLQKAEKPLLILSQEALCGSDGAAVLGLAHDIAEKYGLIQEDWNGFNVLHKAAARVGGLDIGFVLGDKTLRVMDLLKKAQKRDIKALYLLGADEISFEGLEKTFIIYQGHHGDKGAHNADVILPGAAYTEKEGLYVNTEGRVQRGYRAVNPPGEAKEDWKILCTLSEQMGTPLPYDTLEQIRSRLAQEFDVFRDLSKMPKNPWGDFGKSGKVLKKKRAPWTGGFYLTDPISRHSKTMAACTSSLERVSVPKNDLLKPSNRDHES